MKLKQHLLTLGCLLLAWPTAAQVSLAPGGTYTENFDGLGATSGTWVDNATLTGWYASVSNSDGTVGPYTTAYAASTGSSAGNSTTLSSFGASGSSERALGGTPVTTRYGMLGWRLVNGSSTVITNLILTYDGEQWRRDTSLNSSASVSYKIFPAEGGSLDSSGGWTAGPASLIYTPATTGAAGAIDGNAAGNRAPGLTAAFSGINLLPNQEIWFKWTLVKLGGANLPVAIDNVTVSVPLGTSPVIGVISNITVVATHTSVTNTFTINDAEDDSAGKPLPTPIAASSNEAIVSSANVFIGGSGSNRTVYVVAGDTPGAATITVSVTDSDGNIGQQTFSVTVLPQDFPPEISSLPPTNTLRNTDVVIPFTVGDAETPASELTVDGSIAAYSSGVLSSLTFGSDPTGTNRTVTVTPVPDADGVGIVTLQVSDPSGHITSLAFAVMVLPAANIVFNEHFDYPLNTSILNSSPGFWTRRNSSSQSINFRTASSDTQAWIRPKSGADDASAPLAFGPYAPGSGAVLYTLFKAQWVDVGDTPVVGDSDGAFILLAPNPLATADQLVQIATRTNGVPDGFFRLLISNGTSTYAEYAPLDLSVWTTYSLVVRYDVDTAKSTLWINGTSETSPSVSATDDQSPASVGYLSIRQEPNMGNIYLDDLKVRLVRKPTISNITPPAGGSLELYFTAGAGDVATDFTVLQATAVDGNYATVGATVVSAGPATFRASVPVSGNASFFKITRNPITF